LRLELDALEKYVFTLDQQNKQLFNELEKFAMADEMIKSTLDRRGKVTDLKESMQDELMKSQTILRMKSPNRRRDYE
jgi:hypothetical protein